jgi:hypothetical protein
MRRYPEPIGLGTRKARDTHREYSKVRSAPETFSLLISALRNEAWSGGSPRHDTPWLNGGEGPPGVHGIATPYSTPRHASLHNLTDGS